MVFVAVEWSPKNKIEVVKRKLNGENPAQLTLFELEDNSVVSSDYFKIYSDIIKGDSNSDRRNAKSPLNPEEQVNLYCNISFLYRKYKNIV